MKRDRRFAAAGAALILSMLFTASMTWNGTPATLPVETGQSFEPIASSPSPHPAPAETLRTETQGPENEPYEPDMMEVEALARMLYGEARGVPFWNSDTESRRKILLPHLPRTACRVQAWDDGSDDGRERSNPMTNIILAIVTAILLIGGSVWIERIGRGDAE
jgi:predicted cobalt transporter CbtA